MTTEFVGFDFELFGEGIDLEVAEMPPVACGYCHCGYFDP